MSLRGRVLQRTPYSPDCPASSYQSQLAQYRFLQKALRMKQYDVVDMPSASNLIRDFKKVPNPKIARMVDIWSGYMGSESDWALRIPVQKLLSLQLWWQNVAGTVFPQAMKYGFIYQKADGTWLDGTGDYSVSGTANPNTPAVFQIVCDSQRLLSTSSVSGQWNNAEGLWKQGGSVVRAVYFVHPFFRVVMANPSYPSHGLYLAE